jgi:hypothetical protein
MLSGAGTSLALLLIGTRAADPMIGPATSFRSYYLFDMEPVVWGLLASLIAGVSVSLATRPPSEKLVSLMFDAETAKPSPTETPVGAED